MVSEMKKSEVIQGTSAGLAVELQRETPSLKLLERVLGGMRTAIQDKPNHGIPQSVRFKMFSSLPVISEAVITYLQKVLSAAPEGTPVYATLVQGESLDPLYSATEAIDSATVQQSVMDAAMAQKPNFVPLEGGFGIHLSTAIDTLTPLQRGILAKTLPSLEKALLETAESLVPQNSECTDAHTTAALEDFVTLPRTEYEQLVSQATTDKLTGLSNRVGYGVRLDQELGGLTREKDGAVCSYLMVDIDHFKNANDSYGHLKGDEILAAVARVIDNSVRERDIAARFGGEEFMIVLPATDSKTAYMVAERLRQNIAKNIRVPVSTNGTNGENEENGATYTPTVSIGVATGYVVERDMYLSREVLSNLSNEADRALYAAKESGRNRVVVYDASIGGSPAKHSTSQSAPAPVAEERVTGVMHRKAAVLK